MAWLIMKDANMENFCIASTRDLPGGVGGGR